MTEIRLPKATWKYDLQQPLGEPGGFGAVFVGSGSGHSRVAVKRLNVSAGAAQREMMIAEELSGLTAQYIVPVLDSGEDANSGLYFVVMACAGESLQDRLERVSKFTEREAVEVLGDIAAGLVEAREIVVHRDLKPNNVLRHEDRWKIADFGIARFVEDSTAPNTLKYSMTRSYASPEQWNGEHATPATDVYALGCIAYTLLTGHPPFLGPDLRKQHLSENPAPIQGINPQMASLVSMMLRKQPQSRPDVRRVATLLENIAAELDTPSVSAGFGALSQAGAAQAAKAAAEEAEKSEIQAKHDARKNLAVEARSILRQEVINPLFEKIRQAAPNAQPMHDFGITFGSAYIEYAEPSSNFSDVIPEGAFRSSRWDVVTQAKIQVVQEGPKRYEWAANLYYMKRPSEQEYRWWEVQFMTALSGNREFEPFAMAYNDLQEADIAAAPGMPSIQLGAKPKIVDDEYADEFHDRWMKILADAVQGKLRYPGSLPID